MLVRNGICCAILASVPAALVVQTVQQPDKALYDAGVNDIRNGRYERARVTLQTLINTYRASAMLAPSRVAVAGSWYRGGGEHG